MFSSSTHSSPSSRTHSTSSLPGPSALPAPGLTHQHPDSPDWPSNEVPHTDKKVHSPSGQPSTHQPSSCSREPTPHIDLRTVHRLIRLNRKASRHRRFVSLAHHKQSLREFRRMRDHTPSLFMQFLIRGRQLFKTASDLIKSKLSALVSAIQSKLSSITNTLKPFIPWQQHKQLLHCSSAIFSLSAPHDSDPGPTRFDTDSILVGADVCASATLCQFKHLFTDLVPVEGVFLKGVAGRIPVVAKGTLHLNFRGDKGETHTFSIRDSYYVPQLQMTLLCPQQWAKQRLADFGWEDGAQFITRGDFAEFRWDKGNTQLTVPMDDRSNLPIMTTVPGFRNSAHLVANIAIPAVVSDNEDSDSDEESAIQASEPEESSFPSSLFDTSNKPHPVVPDPVLPKDQEEFLRFHERLGHASFHALQKMASSGLIPSKFKHCKVPLCASCQHGKQHKKPWRVKNKQSSPIGGLSIRSPGDCVSVDQLKSSAPGLFGRIKGWLTR